MAQAGLIAAGFATMALATIVALVSAIRSAGNARRLFARLSHTKDRADRGTERFLAAARLATDMRLDDEHRMQALLDQVAAAIRPGVPFFGVFGVVEGADVVALAHAANSDADAASAARPPSPIGARIPLATTLVADLLGAGGVVGWDDLAGTAILAARSFVRERAQRSAIGTSFRVGTRSYFLLFSSHYPTTEPFDDTDRVFIELLTQFFVQRLQQQTQSERLRFNADHDMLTELPNRAAFRRSLRQGRDKLPDGAMIVIDLDNFRAMSQALGYQTADAVIVEIAFALRREAPPGELLARLSADVFATFVPGLEDGAALKRTEQIAAIFAEPFGTGDRLQEERVRVTASVGIATSPSDATEYDALLSRAESAADLAKSAGRDQIAFFKPGVEPARESLRVLRNDLARALREDQLCLYYQPIVRLADGLPVGAEALVRWNHPERGLLLPDRFLPFAEQNGLMIEIDRWVFEHVFADLSKVLAATRQVVVHLNLSPNEIREEWFLNGIRERMRAHPALATRIGIEITETSAMYDPEKTDAVLAELRRLGIMVSIDDFGTGHSSLARLKNYAVDVIKIDRSFITGLPENTYDVALVESMVSLAHRIGLTTLAEGVESDTQIRWLREHGVVQGQGFALGRPLPLGAFLAWIAQHESPLTA